MAIAAKFAREIIKFAGSKGKSKAIEEYGEEAVKDAQKQMQRDAREAYKKKERAKKKAASAPSKTPTGTRKARKVSPKTSKAEARKELGKGMRDRSEDAETTVMGSRERGKVVKKMTRKRARDMISKQENETGEEFMRRMGREAEQTGVGTGRRFSDGDPGYAREQIQDMMRGDYPSGEDTTKDLVEMMGESIGRRKKGGKVAKKNSSSKPLGVGIALCGYGRAMKGTT